MTEAVQDWTDSTQPPYERADWSTYRDMPAFAANNPGQTPTGFI